MALLVSFFEWRLKTGFTVQCNLSPASLCCVLEQDTFNPRLVLVHPRKTRPNINEILLTGCKESNQTNKSMQYDSKKKAITVFLLKNNF